MIFALLIIIILMFLIVTLLKFDLFSPPALILEGFIISTIFGVLNFNQWGDVRLETILFIIMNIAAFIVPIFFLDRMIKIKNYRHNGTASLQRIPILYFFIMTVFSLITTYLFYQYVYESAVASGYPGGIENFLTYVRNAFLEDTNSPISFFLSISLKINFALAYIVSYHLIKNLIVKFKFSKARGFLSTVIIFNYIIQSLLSGGRTRFIFFIVFVVIVLVDQTRLKSTKRKYRKLVLKYIAIYSSLGILIFLFIDIVFRGSIYGTNWTIFEQLSRYFGSPIYALDIYLKNPSYATNFYNFETLTGLYEFISRFNSNINFTNNALEFVYINDNVRYFTNVYGAFRRYIHDYGYLGSLIVVFIFGFIYGLFHKLHKSSSSVIAILYPMLCYPVLFMFFEERIMNDLLTINMILVVSFTLTINIILTRLSYRKFANEN